MVSLGRSRALVTVVGVVLLSCLPTAAAEHDSGQGEQQLTYKISVDYMIRGEVRDEADFDAAASDERDFVGQRLKLKVAGSLHDARYVVQIFDGREWGAERRSGSVEQIGLVQGYLEVGKSFDLRIGRQEITLGKKRFIGSTGWGYKNLAAYDGLRFMTDRGSGSFDLFAVKVAEAELTAADDTDLFGCTYTWKGNDRFKPTLYLLYKSVGDDPVTATDEHTAMPMPGTFGTWLISSGLVLDWEAALQTGTNTGLDHEAAYAHLGLRYTLPAEQAWFGLAYSYASGDDDPFDDTSKTLDKLYGINHSHYGYIDYQDPQNMRNLRLTLGSKLSARVRAQLDYHRFELAEAADRWYSRTATVRLQDPTGAAGTEVGSEIDLTVKLELPFQLNLEIGLSSYRAGDFIKRTATGDVTSSQWGYLQLKRSF